MLVWGMGKPLEGSGIGLSVSQLFPGPLHPLTLLPPPGRLLVLTSSSLVLTKVLKHGCTCGSPAERRVQCGAE